MAKKNKDTTEEVVDAIANLRDHGADCDCSICEQDRKTIADNPEVATKLKKLIP